MTRSARDLRNECERSRAELAATANQLRERMSDTAEDIRQMVSPQYIKSEVSDLVGHKVGSWVHSLKQQARENPLQAVAAGTALGVPLVRLARRFPLPLLMIGAGLALTSKTVRDRAADAAAPALGRAGEVLDEGAEKARALKGNIRAGLSSVQSQAAGIGNDLAENIRSHAAEATNIVGSRIRAGLEATNDAAAASPAKARQAVGDNAALIGGLGIAIGAVIGASLPKTRIESKTMGQASGNLKQSASEAAQSGFMRAKNATISAIDAAAAKIAEADLGGEASRMTQNLADKLQDAADNVERAAFDPSKNPRT